MKMSDENTPLIKIVDMFPEKVVSLDLNLQEWIVTSITQHISTEVNYFLLSSFKFKF